MRAQSIWQRRDLSHFRSTTGEDLFDIHEHFAGWLEHARPGGYWLHELPARSAPAVEIELSERDGLPTQPLVNLASHNYLGLAQHDEVIEAAAAALRRYGLGAVGSPRLGGLLDVHDQLERALAEFLGVESTVLFPSDYGANLGTIAALVGPGDVVITDAAAHAGIIDGCALARAKLVMFRHNDVHSLERRLAEAEGRTLVIVEGVYAMDGDTAPLVEIAALCRRYGARLMVDEAHSAFVYGARGRGLAEHCSVEDSVDVQLGSLSTALGGIGGYVGGSRALTDYIRAYARAHVFSCASTPAVAAGLLAALRLVIEAPQLRESLWRNVASLRGALARHGIDTGNSRSQVIPIMVNDDDAIFAIAEDLLRAGVYLNPIRYPEVKRQRSRFRVSVSAAHDGAMLERAAERIAAVLREHEVIP